MPLAKPIAATLSGAWVPPNHREPLTGFPIWLFHGAWDGTGDKSWSENYYRSVTGESGRIVFDETVLGYPTAISEPVRYSQIPQRAHKIGDEVYANEDTAFYDWMFAQSRASEVLIGDFNGNNVLDVGDVDSLSRQIASGTNDSAHDLTQDGLVNRSDLAFWVKDLKNTWIGDANLDGEFNSSDLVSIFQVGEYEDDLQLNSNWTEGDWDADGEFTTSDLVAAFQDGGFERGPRAAFHVVPEPSAIPVLAIAMFVFPGRGRLSTHQFSVASEVL